jgi:hypothetical protein
VEGESDISLNKSVAAGHFLALGFGAPPFSLAGRGGEEEDRCGALCLVMSKPLAGRGGEERRWCFLVAFASRRGIFPPELGVVRAEQWR